MSLRISSHGMAEQAVRIAGEDVVARADGSLYWPIAKTLFVADVHFGKAATFRALAVPVPSGTTQIILDRLSSALIETRAERLIFLGDLWHARQGRTEPIIESVCKWRQLHKPVEMILVEGNHDKRAGRLPAELFIEEVEAPHLIGPFAACHHPCEEDDAYVLAGHIHPAVRLEGLAEQTIKLPCFWFGQRGGILPTFGEFTGYGVIRPKIGDKVIALAEGQLFELSTN